MAFFFFWASTSTSSSSSLDVRRVAWRAAVRGWEGGNNVQGKEEEEEEVCV